MSSVFTIKKALECKLLHEYKILTGAEGLEREISRITVGEVPDLPKWLHGGELILSTLFAFKDNRSGLEKFIYGLNDGGAAGLCIKTTRFLNDIDDKIIDFCNKHNFPIINIKENVRWSDLIQDLYEAKLAEKIQIETEMRLRGNLLDELIGDDIATDDDVLKRAGFLGFDASHGCVAIIIDIDNFKSLCAGLSSEDAVQRLKEEFYNYVLYTIKPLEHNSLAIPREDSVVLFLNPENKQKIEIITKNLSMNVRKRFTDFTASMGVSRFHDKPLHMLKAYQQAALAIAVSSKIGPPGSILHFEKLGTYKLLLNLAETSPGALNSFCEETIAPLKNYDKEHSGQLLKTLETYLAKEQNIADTAGAMFLHRHSVRYRLSRIKDITGLDINNSEDRERLSIGLKAMRLIKQL